MSIKSKFASGSGWMALGATADYAMQFVIFAILARIISVSDLGIVAFAMVLTDIGRIFVNGGRSELIIQRAEWDHTFGSASFTSTLMAATILALILSLIVSPLLELYYQHGSGLPTAVLSLVLIVEATRSIHGAKLRREFQYRQLASRMVLGTVISGSIAVVMAVNGFGVWALVAQRLIGQLITTTLTLRAARWRPKFIFRHEEMSRTRGFSRSVTGTRALDVAYQRSPDLLIGLMLGPIAVALFRVGARAIEVITRILVQPFQDAAMPALSRMGNPVNIGLALLRVLAATSLLVFPVYFGAAVTGTEVTTLLFGEKYRASGPIMTIMALGVLPATMMQIVAIAYLAAGHAHVSLRANSVSVALMIVAIIIGAHFNGVIGATLGFALVQWLMVPLNLYMLKRYLHLPPLSVLATFAGPFGASVAMAIVAALIQRHYLGGLSVIPRLLATGAIGASLYPIFLMLFARRRVMNVLGELGSILPGRLVRFLSRKPR